MAHDGSLQQGGVQFDLNSQAGVLEVLTSIRNSELSMEDRNELRDLVFLFANGGGDKAVRATLEERLSALGITAPVKVKTSSDTKDTTPQVEPEKAAGGFVSSRPTPTFGAHPKPMPVATVPTAPPPPEAAPAASAQTSAPEKAETAAPAPTSIVPPAEPVMPKSPASASVPTAAPVASTSPGAAVAMAPAGDFADTDQLRRIREIKADVNQRVGNPVNLVDIDNTVGREYMNALLDAMRTVSGGTPQGAQEAMGRLEKSYQRVLEVIEKSPQLGGGEKPMTPPEPPAPKPVPPAPAPAPVTPPAPPAPEPVMPSMPTPPPAPPAPSSAPAPAPQTSFTPHSVPGAESPEVRVMSPASAPTAPSEPDVPEAPSSWAQALSNIKLATIGDRGHDDDKEIEIASPAPMPPSAPQLSPQMPPSAPPAPQPAASMTPQMSPASMTSGAQQPAPGLRSLAQEPPLKKPTDLPKERQRANAASVTGDPLYAPAVDQGLDQLLAEWSLFKKSGLFGTGPKGSEHPLFVKLADLQIPLILAGRFEGATQEIKQSITDYMNGWRYEQGIVYEPGETFEHYLRRVINHILGVQQ